MSGNPNNWPELLGMLRPEDVLLAIDIEEIEKIISRLDQQAAFWAAMRERDSRSRQVAVRAPADKACAS